MFQAYLPYASNCVHVCWIIRSSDFSLLILDFRKICSVDGAILDWKLVSLSYSRYHFKSLILAYLFYCRQRRDYLFCQMVQVSGVLEQQ